MQRFINKIAVISGGAEGLGKAIAERLGNEGARLVLLDINEVLLQHTVQGFRQQGLQVEGLPVNVADEDQIRQAFHHVEQTCGQVHLMVNAAGIVGPTNTTITDYSSAAFDEIYQVNLKGTFLMTKYALTLMQKKDFGRILLIASIAGKEGNPGMVGYSATKAGVIGLVKGVAKEYARSGITINGLAPAVIKTAMNAKTAPAQLDYMLAKIPMNRLGTVEEVAAMSAFILSDECTFTTGFIFDLSGGRATY